MTNGNNDVIVRLENKKDKLIKYLSSNRNDPEMERLWDMFVNIESKLRSMHKKHVVNYVMKQYNVSRSWSHKLVKEAMAFSGAAHKPDTDFLRVIHIDGLTLAIKKALAAQQYKALAPLYKELRLWLFPYDDPTQDLDKLQLHVFQMQISLGSETADLPLDLFYKLQEKERVALQEAQSADSYEIPAWDEIKEQMDTDEN